MNAVTVSSDSLQVEPQCLDKLWAFKRKLDIPLTHVRGATFDPGANNEPKGLRGPGLAVPGKWAGTFRRGGDIAFWNVSTPGKTIVIELAHEHYTRLVLTVENPRDVVDAINNAIPAETGR